ncbi:MAG: hypothetical protein WCU88_01615 [Elusimicrobiota bacterium]|jgi:hypothetical protein
MTKTLLSAFIALWTPGFAAAQPALEAAAKDAAALITVAKNSGRKIARPAKEPAETIIPHFQQKDFPAPAGGACGLKRFTLLDSESREIDGPRQLSRLSSMGAVIETTSPDCIRDYGIVQFIKGCVYHTVYSAKTGALVEKKFDITRALRGVNKVIFNHPSYEVDQDGTDPLYIAVPEETDRLAFAYVPKTPLKLRPDRQSMFADLKILDDPRQLTILKRHPEPTSVLLAIDVPLGGISAFDDRRMEISASNSSLDFKTCVYRIKDIPAAGDPAGEGTPPENGGPLQCFSWSSRYTYDGESQDFVTDKFKGIDPFCSQAPARGH